MADVEVCEKEVQTSRPPTDRPSDQHVLLPTQTSAVSDFSCKSSETLSEGKLDSLFANSMQILVRRVDGGGSKRPSIEFPISVQPGDPCAISGCTGTVSKNTSLPPVFNLYGNRVQSSGNQSETVDNYSDHFDRTSSYYENSPTASRHSSKYGRHSGLFRQNSRTNSRQYDHLSQSGRYSGLLSNSGNRNGGIKDHSSLRLDGISPITRGFNFKDIDFSPNNQKSITCVDDRRPHKPIKPRPMLTRSKTTIPATTPASRQCDACSVRDLQSWFTINPGQMVSPRPPNNVISPTRLTREKSQVFLLNKQPKLDAVGENMAEVMLPMATVPKKGLIKLSCLDEDHVTDDVQYQPEKLRSRRREPLRPLIKNKKILNEISEIYNQLLEEERLERDQVHKLLRHDNSSYLSTI